MGPLVKPAATKDAPTKPRKEESVCGMGQSEFRKPAVTKDAPTMFSKEDSVLDMGQSEFSKPAVTKDVSKNLSKEDYVCGMGQLPKLAVMRDASNQFVKGGMEKSLLVKNRPTPLHAFRWFVTQAQLVLLPDHCTCIHYDGCPEESE